MLLKDYRKIFLQELTSLYDEKEVESFFYLVLDNFHQKKRIDLALNPAMEINAEVAARWENVVAELKKQKPIQYILGETEFYGLRFLVNEHVLIPRPETEELIELIINEEGKREKEKVRILDIGTGSGCIAISLAKNLPNAEVFAIDVSEAALATAKKNAELNNVEVNFINADILKIDDLQQLRTSHLVLPTSFDIIVSNPPYVRNLEKTEINPNVLEYEPHLALFVEDNDALLFYRKITQLAKENLNPGGQLYFEINQYLGKETAELVESYGFKDVKLLKDIYGNDRMILAHP